MHYFRNKKSRKSKTSKKQNTSSPLGRKPSHSGSGSGDYKSSLEKKFAILAKKNKLPFTYEPAKFPYVVTSHYLPDFQIAENRFIETKGYFSSSNRQRMLLFKEQHPDVEIIFLFGNWDNKLNSNSKTTYREWAEKHGFRCGDIRNKLPGEWWD